MISKCFGLLVLALLVALNAGLTGYYYTILPARVGLYEFDFGFEPSAEPTVWMAKGTLALLIMAAIMLAPLELLFQAWICTKLPKRMISIPNRDYWLSPERKAETDARLFSFMLWLANATELFLTAVFAIVYRTLLGHPEVLRRTPYYVLGCFLAFVAVWSIRYYIRFKKLPST
jgi:hypothetical protein